MSKPAVKPIPEPWPPDYKREILWRHRQGERLNKDPGFLAGAINAYRSPKSAVQFISDWGVIHEPRAAFSDDAPPQIPFVLFKRQREFIEFVIDCLYNGERGLCEKSRDVGATWCCVWISIWLFLFYPGAAVGWGSQDSQDVDRIGDTNSIFEKIRIGLRALPPEFMPDGFSFKEHMMFMRIINPQTGASITGGVGDNIGRGGRTLIFFKDEASHYVHAEMIEAALSQNAKVQIDVSSVYGTNTVFHRRRENGVEWFPGAKLEKGRTRVFVFDWRSHPSKTQEWYDLLRAEYERTGLLHVLAQEIDRDYAAAVEGVVIPALWVKAAIDAHIKLEIPDDGNYAGGLDVADEGGDLNALVTRRGPILKTAEEWGERDTGETTRRAIATCRNCGRMDLQYDSIGVGAGVKAEANRLEKEFQMPKGLRLIPWNAGGEVQDKDRKYIPGDANSPANGEMFQNVRAQAAWSLRRRFETTYRAINEEGFTFDTDDCISIPSGLPLRYKIEKELSQPIMTQSSSLKMTIDKKPDGARSPNLFDAIVKCYFPMKNHRLMKFSDDMLNRLRIEGPRRRI